MYIDDEWEILKIADHNLIKIQLSFYKNKKYNDKTIIFNSISIKNIDKYLLDVNQNIIDS